MEHELQVSLKDHTLSMGKKWRLGLLGTLRIMGKQVRLTFPMSHEMW